jgi:hypothetical protein
LHFKSNCFAVLQVSAVAFDPYWSPPNSDEAEENVMYRFGSVGQVPRSSYNIFVFNSEYSCVLYSSITELCDEYTSLRLHAPARLLSFWSFATLLINLGVSFFMV